MCSGLPVPPQPFLPTWEHSQGARFLHPDTEMHLASYFRCEFSPIGPSRLPGPLYEWRLGLPWTLALPWPGSCSWACWPTVWKLLNPETSQWKTLSTFTLQVSLCSLRCRNATLNKMWVEKQPGEGGLQCRPRLWFNWGVQTLPKRLCVLPSPFCKVFISYFKANY